LGGDHVLVKAASLVADSLREIDIAARYGGEEFAVVLPDTPRMGAFVVADRIRRRVQDHFRRRRGGPAVTVSGGVATFPDDAADYNGGMLLGGAVLALVLTAAASAQAAPAVPPATPEAPVVRAIGLEGVTVLPPRTVYRAIVLRPGGRLRRDPASYATDLQQG